MRSDVELRRDQLLALLLSGTEPGEAAARVGIASRTFRRYLADPTFKRELDALQDQRLEAIARLALDQADEALRSLTEILGDETANAKARVSAGGVVLNFVLRSNETVRLAREVEELRRQVESEGEGDDGDAGERSA